MTRVFTDDGDVRNRGRMLGRTQIKTAKTDGYERAGHFRQAQALAVPQPLPAILLRLR